MPNNVYGAMKTTFETRCFLAQQQSIFKSQSLSFKAYKMYIAAILTHLVLKLYENKNLRFSFKAYTADDG